MPSLRFPVVVLLLGLAACGPETGTVEDLRLHTVTLPNGSQIRAEILTTQDELITGMKHRESLDEDRGLLFVYGKEGYYAFWMYEVKVPLDMIWIDQSRKIVQLVHECPPCPGPREKCPSYGGQVPAQYILEVRAGVAKKQGLKPGMLLSF